MTTAYGNARSGQQGMALVVVLWVVVLLSIIAAAHASNVHATTRLTARQLEFAQLKASAGSGVQRAILELLAQRGEGPWPINGQVRTVSIMDRDVSIAVRSATGLIDINSATPQLLAALFDATSADKDTKAALVDAVLDWRDADDLTRLQGAEADAYGGAHGDWTIRNGAFVSVDELRYVRGMTNQLFQEIAPFITIHSGFAGVDFEYAPVALIQALTGQPVQTANDVVPAGQPATSRQVSRSGTFHIYAEASSATARAALEAVVRIEPTADVPFTVLQWRETGRSLPARAR